MLKISELIPAYNEHLHEYRDMASKAKEMLNQVDETEASLANMDSEERAAVDYLFRCN